MEIDETGHGTAEEDMLWLYHGEYAKFWLMKIRTTGAAQKMAIKVVYVCVCVCLLITSISMIFRSGTDLLSLLILFLMCFFLFRWPLEKRLSLNRFKSDRDEMWQDYSSSKYASIDGVRFLIWRHTLTRSSAIAVIADRTACRSTIG